MSARAATSAPAAAVAHDRRRWFALGFIALAQLMIALDATVVSVALPTVQRALHGSVAARQWIITAYMVTFAGLLLLCGAIADAIGRRRAFCIGLIGFALSSMLGGAADRFELLIAARALQGAFAALLSPSALALLAVTFTERHDRARAFAIYGGVAASGGAIGLILGGWLTQAVSWRYCLYINLPVALLALSGAQLTLGAEPASARRRIDVWSGVLATGGLGAIVYACSAALGRGWASVHVLGAFACGAALLTLFVARQRREAPLLPLSIVLDRRRGGVAIAAALAIVAMFGLFLLLTYDFQVVRRASPLQTGLAFLPLSAASLFGGAGVASRLLPRVAPRVLLVSGLSIAAAGLAALTRLHVGSAYVTGILPSEIAVGFGVSCAMITSFSVATWNVPPRQAGVASSVLVTAQQIGGSLGTALLNTVAASATAAWSAAHGGGDPRVGLVHGYAVATGWGCVLLVAAAVIAGVLVDLGKPGATASDS
jgi:EmrB/QacA subfamily drug resistance transporter